jgi:hypothetical protein
MRSSSKCPKLAALPPAKFEIRVEHAKARVEGMTTSAPTYKDVEFTGENEWFTPAAYVEMARAALGEIDFDPASHAVAQQTVRAKTFSPSSTTGSSGRGSEGFGSTRPTVASCSPRSLESSSRNTRAAR